ncbi:MAG: hypothetical protein GY805_32600, partial [Chloroflexi bacterium]|nr:hypothetical protein [Chloroflexota bacterium]
LWWWGNGLINGKLLIENGYWMTRSGWETAVPHVISRFAVVGNGRSNRQSSMEIGWATERPLQKQFASHLDAPFCGAILVERLASTRYACLILLFVYFDAIYW